jgi:hypothetical protein
MGTVGSWSLAAMAAASVWVKERSDAAWLYLRSSPELSPVRWVCTKLWAVVRAFGRLVRWILVPTGDAPLDVLKHYVSVLIVLIGAGALLWSAKQIAFPPLVITVAKLPELLEKEYWLNPELSRTLIGEIERLREVVKGERDPSFEAVLNPPNIVVKTPEWSLNVQEQILTPLSSLLGRGQGEVHLALNCYHPGCARTTDKECRDLAPLKTSDSKVSESLAADGKAASRQYLCLRLTADIQRGLSHSRLTPRLIVSPDDAEMTDAMGRVAEAVTTVADPATATLYFYRRIREMKRDPNVAADAIADLIGKASNAAEQAEKTDAVSACWAHTIRAHLAVDQREFNLAEVYLARARNISSQSRSSRLTSRSDCQRLIMIAEMEFARQLAEPPENETYPPHQENNDKKRVLAAFRRVQSLLDQQQPAGWASVFGSSTESEDLTEALKLVQAEIGLSPVGRWIAPPDQCQLLKAGRYRQPDKESPGAAGANPEVQSAISTVRSTIRNAAEKLNWLPPEEELPPLTRQAALDFMSRFARNLSSLNLMSTVAQECTKDVVEILQKLDLNHPADERVRQLLLAITEDIALRKTDSLGRPASDEDRGNSMIEAARKIYQRVAATGTGSDRTVALTKLAIISEANRAEAGDEGPDSSKETFEHLTRAWQRHVNDINSTRESGELIVSFWGMTLMRSFPAPILEADFLDTDLELTVNAEYRDAIAKKAEFERALQTLYPSARPNKLSALPHLKGIGPRIGCLCMLAYVTRKNELADFFIGRLDRWQKQKTDQQTCRHELIPKTQTRVPYQIERLASIAARKLIEAEQKLIKAEEELQKAASKTSKLQEDFEEKKNARANAQEAHEKAQQDLREAKTNAENAAMVFRKKDEAAKKAAEICYVDTPPPSAPTASLLWP